MFLIRTSLILFVCLLTGSMAAAQGIEVAGGLTVPATQASTDYDSSYVPPFRLIFDGNIQSLPGYFVYDASVNRAVSVDSRAIIEALRMVYGATALADEMLGKPLTRR